MRLSNTQAVARPIPIDRNGVGKVNSYSVSTVAPHAATTRFSYTVPAGRKCQVNTAAANVTRDGVATTSNYVFASINYLPGGVSSTVLFQGNMVLNTIGSQAQQFGAVGLLMASGDMIVGQSTDLSTAGTNWYNLSWSGTEFDT